MRQWDKENTVKFENTLRAELRGDCPPAVAYRRCSKVEVKAKSNFLNKNHLKVVKNR